MVKVERLRFQDAPPGRLYIYFACARACISASSMSKLA